MYANQSRTRKRRAASLTAEALWNIQLEDDIMGCSQHCKSAADFSKKITLRESAKAPSAKSDPQHEVNNFDESETGQTKRIKNQSRSQEIGAMKSMSVPCQRHASYNPPSNSSKVYRNKGKLTASVAPQMKICPKETHKNGEHMSVINEARTSQVLLLPISLDPAVNTIAGVDHSVPLLALHASPVNLELMHCLNRTQIISPLVTVTPLLTGQPGISSKLASRNQRKCDIKFNSKGPISTKAINILSSCSTPSDQIEPLNLKLGESSIPSCRKPKCELNNPVKGTSKSMVQYSKNRRQLLSKNSGIQFQPCKSLVEHPNSKAISVFPSNVITSQESKFRVSRAGTSTGFSSFNVQSPSSESSCSVESDESNGFPRISRRSNKSQINLRCKAAAPPYMKQHIAKNQRYFDGICYDKVCMKKKTTCENCDFSNNGWKWDGKSYQAHVYSVDLGKPVLRRCYPAMRRASTSSSSNDEESIDDDVVMVRDCVMMRADGDEQAYVAKIAALWEHPKNLTMMISLLWFYRPEHTEDLRVQTQLDRYCDSELFASRHLDEISVACVEDKCFVLTYNEYCRFHAKERKDFHVGLQDNRNLLPSFSSSSNLLTKANRIIPSSVHISIVFFCRKLYDVKLNRLLKTFSNPLSLFSVYKTTTENREQV